MTNSTSFVDKRTTIQAAWLNDINGAVFSDFANVKRYGAVGDGVTDDLAAFQAAMAASRCVFVPEGTYALSAELNPTDQMTLFGVGDKSVLLFTGATNGINVTANYARVCIHHLSISTSNSGALTAIKFPNYNHSPHNSSIHDVTIDNSPIEQGFWAKGFWASSLQTGTFAHIKMRQSAKIGFKIEYGSNASTFTDCEVIGHSSSTNGLILTDDSSFGGTSLTFETNFYGCTFQGNFSASAVSIDGVSGLFFGGHIENTDATPSDGADVLVAGSVNTHFFGVQGGSYLTSGTVRNFSIAHSEVSEITLGASTHAALVGVRYSSLTSSAPVLTVVGCGLSSGTSVANLLMNSVNYRSSIPSITNNSATPSISDTEVVRFSNTNSTTVTSISGGYQGQRLTALFGNTNTTLQDGTGLRLAGDYTPSNTNGTIFLVYDTNHWVEVARSTN